MKVNTEIAFAVCVGGLLLGYAWATFFPTAPFGELALALPACLAVIAGKRVWQRHRNYRYDEEGTNEE